MSGLLPVARMASPSLVFKNTEETETTLKTEITRGNMQLEICLNKINGSYEIAKWRCTARWQPDDSLNLG